jgi:hypothetical protein
MDFDDFVGLLDEKDYGKDEKLSAFVYFCFLQLFDKNDPASEFLAAAGAHSFSSNSYAKAVRITHKSLNLRYKPMKIKEASGLKMRM